MRCDTFGFFFSGSGFFYLARTGKLKIPILLRVMELIDFCHVLSAFRCEYCKTRLYRTVECRNIPGLCFLISRLIIPASLTLFNESYSYHTSHILHEWWRNSFFVNGKLYETQVEWNAILSDTRWNVEYHNHKWKSDHWIQFCYLYWLF